MRWCQIGYQGENDCKGRGQLYLEAGRGQPGEERPVCSECPDEKAEVVSEPLCKNSPD